MARLRWDLLRTDLESIFEGTESADDTVERYLRRRGFSDRFVENFAAPFYGGITLDRSLSTSERVFRYTFRTLAEGDTAVPADGMGAIPEQLAEKAREEGATIETGTEVSAVSSTEADGSSAAVTVEGETIDADAVVVATDPPTARDLTAVDSIPIDARRCVTQWYSLPGDAALDAGKRLLLNATETGPNHVVPHSAVAPEYAPEGETLLSATYLGDREESDDELAERTRRTLAAWYPERRFDRLETIHTDRIDFAQFDQPPGIHDRLPDPRDPTGAVYLAGDFTRWSSIQGAMESGRVAAKAVVEDLSG